MKNRFVKRLLIICAVLAGLFLISLYPAYRIARHAFNRYFNDWGDRLVSLEKRGMLSTRFGAAWQDILADEAMDQNARRITGRDSTAQPEYLKIVDGVPVDDYPSLSIIRRLNEIRNYSNTIEIVDRKERPIAVIRTNHTRARFNELPPVLITALIAAEDGCFFTNRLGFEFDSYLRAIGRALIDAALHLRKPVPRGTSTITQQVAKLFISDIDTEGRRVAHRTIDRKLREMRLAAALRKTCAAREIIEVYANHCVTSDHGLIGYKDIARGLFGKELNALTDAECVYLARMVKWGRNVHPKIARQCRIDMPRMAAALHWDAIRQKAVLARIDSLKFQTPQLVQTGSGALVDLANEFWLRTLARNGAGESQLAGMNIIDPNSLVRKKGNLRLQLTIDLPLQQLLQRLVDTRGYGGDTVIATDVRIGSSGQDLAAARRPPDTVRAVSIMRHDTSFTEPGSDYRTTLAPGDTLITNVRYSRIDEGKYRRACFYYRRGPVRVDGQYFAYAIMDSKSGELLAYHSKDKIGSRLSCLLANRTPNGSSTAKPIFNALMFDLGIFRPCDTWDDSVEVMDDVPWRRNFFRMPGKPAGVVFVNGPWKGLGYQVSNHYGIFEGCGYVFDHLATSNNILGAETVYRINRPLFSGDGEVADGALPLAQLLERAGAFSRVKDSLKIKYITGVRVYKELCRIVGVDIDSVQAYGRRAPVSDSLYSVALGTLELTLYEQLHLFNMLYANDLIERPADHPSLVIKSLTLNGDTIPLADTVRLYHPFSDINRIRPTLLGLHKRLISNAGDGLAAFDIPYSGDPAHAASDANTWSEDAFWLDAPLSNFAKSGTTDDVIRPFNVDVTSVRRTNYGLWNAVVRIDLSRLAGGGDTREVRDITIACIGECNTRFTGERDGKTLHKFVSRDLLRMAGAPAPNGFFAQYENYLKRVTPDSIRLCGKNAAPAENAEIRKIQETGD